MSSYQLINFTKPNLIKMSFSSFIKESRAQLDKAQEKGRTYYQKGQDYYAKNSGSLMNDINPLNHKKNSKNTNQHGHSGSAPFVNAPPLSSLPDRHSFPAPPVHLVAHGEITRPVPAGHHGLQSQSSFSQPPIPPRPSSTTSSFSSSNWVGSGLHSFPPPPPTPSRHSNTSQYGSQYGSQGHYTPPLPARPEVPPPVPMRPTSINSQSPGTSGAAPSSLSIPGGFNDFPPDEAPPPYSLTADPRETSVNNAANSSDSNVGNTNRANETSNANQQNSSHGNSSFSIPPLTHTVITSSVNNNSTNNNQPALVPFNTSSHETSSSFSSASNIHNQTHASAPTSIPNDPLGQYDLNLSTLWFTQPSNSSTLQLPPTLQNLKYAYTATSDGPNNQSLILAFRVPETLAIVKFKLTWLTSSSDILSTVRVERKDLPAPVQLGQQQLEQAHAEFGNLVALFAETKRGTQSNGTSLIGGAQESNGCESWILAKQALDSTPGALPAQQYTFGAIVYKAKGLEYGSVVYNDRISRGDIVQFESARFETNMSGTTNQGNFGQEINNQGVTSQGTGQNQGPNQGMPQVSVGAPHHTAIIVNVSPDNRTIDVLHQNFQGIKTVEPATFNLDQLVAGQVTVYRPVWREWASELKAAWD